MKTIQVFVLVVFLTQTLVSGAPLSVPSSDPVLGQNELDDQMDFNLESVRTVEEQTKPPSIQSAPLNSRASTYLEPQTIQSVSQNSSKSTYLEPLTIQPAPQSLSTGTYLDSQTIQEAPQNSGPNKYLDLDLITGMPIYPMQIHPEDPWKIFWIVVGSFILAPLILIPVCFGVFLLVTLCFMRKERPNVPQNPSSPTFSAQNLTNPTSPILEAQN